MGIRHHSALIAGDWMEDPDSFSPDPPMIKVVERLSDHRVRVADGTRPDARTWELTFGPTEMVHLVRDAGV